MALEGHTHGAGTGCAAASNMVSGELQSLHWPALAANKRASSICSRAHCPADSTEPGLDALTQPRAACAPFPVSSIVSACRAQESSRQGKPRQCTQFCTCCDRVQPPPSSLLSTAAHPGWAPTVNRVPVLPMPAVQWTSTLPPCWCCRLTKSCAALTCTERED